MTNKGGGQSGRKALKKLSQTLPTPPEIESIMQDLGKESDLAAAITGTALAEAALERLLRSKITALSATFLNELFQYRAPLGDFSGKILIAQAFEIITSTMAEEMQSLRVIRNAFAHSKIPLSFDHEVLAKEIMSLRMASAIRRQADKEQDPTQLLGASALARVLSNRAWFLLTISILLIIIDVLEKSPLKADAAIAAALKT
jgi:hypothetical protein